MAAYDALPFFELMKRLFAGCSDKSSFIDLVFRTIIIVPNARSREQSRNCMRFVLVPFLI